MSYRAEELLGLLNPTEKKHAPETLYVEGDVSLLGHVPRVSVIGSRDASPRGLRGAEFLCEKLLARDTVIVSGLARGIDTVAHKCALASSGRTIAVIGTPLSRCSPRENTALQQEIARNHLLLSQFSENHTTTRKDFVLRNRTMALVSHASIIVEAKEKSGTEHQGWEALRLGRTLLIPEPLVQALSWAQKMVGYGALPFTRDTIDELLDFHLPAKLAEELRELPF